MLCRVMYVPIYIFFILMWPKMPTFRYPRQLTLSNFIDINKS